MINRVCTAIRKHCDVTRIFSCFASLLLFLQASIFYMYGKLRIKNYFCLDTFEPFISLNIDCYLSMSAYILYKIALKLIKNRKGSPMGTASEICIFLCLAQKCCYKCCMIFEICMCVLRGHKDKNYFA